MSFLKINQAIQKAFRELKTIARTEFQLFDSRGNALASTKPLCKDQDEPLMAFLDSPAQGQELDGVHFFKVRVRGEEDYALLAQGSGEDVYMLGKIAVCQAENLLLAYRERQDVNSFLQNLILDNLLWVDIHNRA